MIDETVRDHSWSARVNAKDFLRKHGDFAHLICLEYMQHRGRWESDLWLATLAELDKLYIERDEI